MNTLLDFTDYTTVKDKMLSNVLLAEELRFQHNLDNPPAKFTVFIPHYIYGITTAFFDKLFGPTVLTLGKDKFRKQFVFESDNPSVIKFIHSAVDELWERNQVEKVDSEDDEDI